jgi:two-component system invasion response regulator UvrY
MRLMIVDDHAGVRQLIRQLVALPGDAVRECASGNEAVPLARDFKPDYVTMDVRMAGLDGFEATRALCGDHPAVRVVIVTAFDQAELRRSAMAAGAVGYVAKEHLTQLRSVLLTGGDLIDRGWPRGDGSVELR